MVDTTVEAGADRRTDTAVSLGMFCRALSARMHRVVTGCELKFALNVGF